ncbi:hypothetical protein Fmac_025997 [Flemingia macrophylla]|uniref:Uncharacterized protein n=1 Tax=Flemingia macrophylla TaxID=520843 RepID=A0ABD1LE60_9FABA
MANDGGVVKFVYTPMLENPKHLYFYYVGLRGILVGKCEDDFDARNAAAGGRVGRRRSGSVVVDSINGFSLQISSHPQLHSLTRSFSFRCTRLSQLLSIPSSVLNTAWNCYTTNDIMMYGHMFFRNLFGNSPLGFKRKATSEEEKNEVALNISLSLVFQLLASLHLKAGR